MTRLTSSIKVDTVRLETKQRALRQRTEDILDVAAHRIEVRWKNNIVVKNVWDTGAYFGSVGVREEHRPLERIISDGVHYGIYQEFGHHTVAARPCAVPAVDAERASFQKAWEALLK